MLNKESLFTVVCRPALPSDTEEVLGFTRAIWEGQDYIPQVWAEWLTDPAGLLAVAEFSGKAVGIGKLTRLSEGQWWMEGLRVNPEYEGRGIASHLHDYLLGIWERTLGGTIRLVTASFRKPVHHLAQRTGFHQVGEITYYSAESEIAEVSAAFSWISEDEIPRAIEFIKDSETNQLANGFIDLGWQWASLEPPFLIEAVRGRQALWWRDGAGLVITREDDEGEGRTSFIQLLACRESEAVLCLSEFKQLGKGRGSVRVGWFVQLNPILVGLLEKAGYHREWDTSLYLFEKTQMEKKN